MKSLKRSVTDLVFGIYCWKQFPGIDHLKSSYLWFELQADQEVENRFWIEDVGYPNILLIEVATDRSLDLAQTYLSYWRSYHCSIIWIIDDGISDQPLNHPIHRQLLKDISPAGECILHHSAVSEYSVTTIANNLLSRFLAQSQQNTVGNRPPEGMNLEFSHLEMLCDDRNRSAA